MNLFDIWAKLSLDTSRYDEGLANASGLAVVTGKQIVSAFMDVAQMLAGLVKQSVESYAEYEQLVGGVETLFKDSSNAVLTNAQNAYRTAGISASQYMQTVTSFSGSLIQSTGRSAQIDLAELQANLDAQYKEAKRHWEDRIALVKDSADKVSLKRQMEDDLEMLKEHNRAVLAQAQDANMTSVSTAESLAEAAKLADMAIVDMSDNANKMGTDMGMLQNAYQGFSKQNYMMLDNLKLGYGGTRTEMERLLKDAERFSGIKYDISSYADVVQAIHVIQQEMEISGRTAEEAAEIYKRTGRQVSEQLGTTAKEATTTIEGSFKMMQSAWQDLVVSFAGGGKSVSESMNGLIEAVGYVIQNTFPVIIQAIQGIGDLIYQITPIIAEALPQLLESLIPMFLNTVLYLVQAIADQLPYLITVIAEALIGILPQLADAVISLFDSLITVIIPALIEVGIQLVLALGNSLAENASKMTESIIVLLVFLIQTIIDHLPEIILVGLQILNGLIEGIVSNLHLITDAVVILIKTLILTIFEHLPDILAAAIEIGLKIVAGIVFAIPSLIVSVGRMLGIVQDTKDQVEDHSLKMQNSVNDSTTGISSSIDSMINKLNNKTDQARGMLTKTSSVTADTTDNMNKKADDMIKTSADAEKSVSKTMNSIVGVIVFARASLQDAFEKMTVMIESLKLKFEELGKITAIPKVDPSGVEAGCNAIIEACNDAIRALADLHAAQGSSGGYGGGRASGGWISSGMTYLVGEHGPELITATNNAYVHNASETAGILGSRGDIYITISGDVYDDEMSMRRKIRSAVTSVLDEEMSYA